MSNPNKAKGTTWERNVRTYLREHLDPRAYSPRQEGYLDQGDIHAWTAVFQAKDWRDWQSAIRVGLDGAVAQAENSKRWPPVAVVKRARRPVGDAYAVLRLSDLVRLLAAARGSSQEE